MEWFVGIAAVAAFFIWHGFRTRCPACGKSALHPRDSAGEAKQRAHYQNLQSTGMLEGLDRVGSSFGTQRAKPGYANRRLRCKKCGHSFDRTTAVTWLAAANKLGEEVALREYRNLGNESDGDGTV